MFKNEFPIVFIAIFFCVDSINFFSKHTYKIEKAIYWFGPEYNKYLFLFCQSSILAL